MDKLGAVLEIIVPIFATILLGILARQKKLIAAEEVNGKS